MKIASSAVDFAAKRSFLSVNQSSTFQLRMSRRAPEQDKETNQMPDHGERAGSRQQEKQQGASLQISGEARSLYAGRMELQRTDRDAGQDIPDQTIETLRSLLRMLRSLGGSSKAIENLERLIDNRQQLARLSKSHTGAPDGMMHLAGAVQAAQGSNASETVSVTHTESFRAEQEYTSFSAKGIAMTEDGRAIDFKVDLEMSRSFMEYSEINNEDVKTRVCDPLVINLHGGAADVTDQKFRFDLDADGKEDMISRLGAGSGFLAYDKNGNGIIDNGKELFGARSGDGFRDLAQYDKDRNGWIDENDDIFSKLKVWYQDSSGNDRLLSLKEAGVGAIYLGNADTQFSLKSDESQQTNAVVRSSGIYLKENGGAGTIQHVDFVL